MTSRLLTITADDFGWCPQVNTAIAELARQGAIHATSLLTTAAHAQQALDLDLPIDVGLHVDLPAAQLATAPAQHVVDLIEAQLDWMVARGRPPAHLDLHTPALYGLGPGARPGGVIAEALTVAGRHQLAIRLPKHLPDDVAAAGQPMPPGLAGLGPEAVTRHAQLVAAAETAGVALPEMIFTDPRPPEQIAGAADTQRYYLGLAGALAPGHNELFLHPAAGGPEVKRRWEYQLLRSGKLHAHLRTAGIVLGPRPQTRPRGVQRR